MDIRTAIMARTADKPYITRKSWVDQMGPYSNKVAKIMPTDSIDCCIMTALSREPIRGWQPSASDLTAEDWEPCG